MSEVFFISMDAVNGWSCQCCDTYIHGVLNKNTGIIEPSSKYWNVKRKEVFCSAKHALKRHEEVRRKQ